ncbi:flavodoxin domain-containing protein [Desulfuribacillus alkaliarsenatis]|uniref:Flavodoxin-like domain-containing protein n=1 Tax=Desulfuribacillus alkaliarsenatis TaxID=766136 RepID=A0A1E5FYQ5_9FIRM|nr:flavodoxin domain-containing protein [Desulfuribacillus alkaliarsenatis]OEF95699.1 hypothetical protein BHF68_11370 [Desulfuribacillus alkaliarsenatis]
MSDRNGISRKQFITRATAAGIGIAFLGGGFFATRSPEVDYYEALQAIDASSNNPHRTLVAYASMYGSTGEVAKEIAETIATHSNTIVDVALIDNITDVSAYDQIIIGAPVKIGAWLPDAVSFVEENRQQLQNKKVSYFLTSMILANSDDATERGEIYNIFNDLEQQIPEVQPVHKGYFAGAIDYDKMAPAMRVAFRMMSSVAGQDSAAGDFRDWNAISAWASELTENVSI